MVGRMPERSLQSRQSHGDARVKRVRPQSARRPYNTFKKFEKKTAQLARAPGGGYYSVVDDGTPYESAEERRARELREAKAKWQGHGTFLTAVGVRTTHLKPAPRITSAGPFKNSILNFRFRDEVKEAFVDPRGFRLDGNKPLDYVRR